MFCKKIKKVAREGKKITFAKLKNTEKTTSLCIGH